MKKCLLFGLWLLLVGWMQPEQCVASLKFENDSWISEKASQLRLEVSQPIGGKLYHACDLILEIKPEDYQYVQEHFYLEIPAEKTGWYSFYDEKDQCLAQAVFMAEQQVMMGVNQLYQVDQNRYFLKKSAEVAWIAHASLNAFEGLEVKKAADWEIYTAKIDQEKSQTFCLNEQSWEFILDSSAPKISVPNDYIREPEKILFLDSYLDWEKSSLMIDGKEAKEVCQSEEAGYSFLITQSVSLEADCWDLAGNHQQIKKKVIYDDQAPSCKSYFSDGKFYLEAADEYLSQDPFASLCLYYGQNIVPFVKENNKCYAQITQDGTYSWQGSIQDLAGNSTSIDQQMFLDVEKPSIYCDYELQDYYEAPLSVHFEWYDAGLKSWQLLLYRNDCLIENYQGMENGSLDLYLDDKDYEDGLGQYRAEMSAADGIHETLVERTWILDMSCAPIQINIQGVDAQNVEEITVLKPLDISLYCSEGEVNWQLFNEQQIVLSGTGDLKLNPELKATALKIWAADNLGHERKKTLSLDYPQKEENPALTLYDGKKEIDNPQWRMAGSVLQGKSFLAGSYDVYVDGKKQQSFSSPTDFEIEVNDAKKHEIAIVFEDTSGTMSISRWQVIGKKHHNYMIWIGGVLIAGDFMRRICSHCLRNKRHKADLLDTATLEINDPSDDAGNLC